MWRTVLLGSSTAAALLFAAQLPRVSAQDARVDLNLTVGQGARIVAAQQWLPVLDAVGFSSTRISSEVSDHPMEIVTTGSEASPIYKVNGVLTPGGDVMLPPAKRFSQRDRAGLKQWVTTLKTQGPEGASGVKLPFGLTKAQFEEARKELRTAVTTATLSTEPTATLTEITRNLANPVVLDAAARQALADSGVVRDELQGLAIGTAVAALVRPAGLVLRPRFVGGKLEYVVTDGRGGGDHWPIGWASKEGSGKLVPNLLEKEQTQDVEVPLADAIHEIQARVGVPFVYDYNGMAALGVDLATTKAKLKAGETYYGRLLTRMLTQAKLKFEVRQDDAGRPFLWISTIR